MTDQRDRPVTTEVTPEMIEAGALAYVGWDHGEDDAEAIVAEILRSALAASPELNPAS